MRRPKAILLAAVLTGVLSSGCTRIHSADELTQDTRPETTPVFTDTPQLNFSTTRSCRSPMCFTTWTRTARRS